MKYSTPCIKHKYKFKKQIEPRYSKKLDGYKLYVCSICGKEYKKIISYKGEY